MLKLPVVCYDTGGIRDVIIHNENGLLATKGDWHILAHNMLRISKDPSLQQKFREYPDNLQDFRDDEMIAQHAALYKQLLAS
jgi:glycosyltransferase involved in cell wall biosynthesis